LHKKLLLVRETRYTRQNKKATFTFIEECSTSDILKLRKMTQIMKCSELHKLLVAKLISSVQRRSYYTVAKLPI
jgi:hypothetical protein